MTRILVVDDERDTLDVMRLFLELSGYEAITTLNSTDALTLAEVENPDCILLDVMMPELDGFSLCRMMRAHPHTTALPIMFVTAYSPIDLEDRRREVGADGVLMKPFGMDSLVKSVEKVIAGRTFTVDTAQPAQNTTPNTTPKTTDTTEVRFVPQGLVSSGKLGIVDAFGLSIL